MNPTNPPKRTNPTIKIFNTTEAINPTTPTATRRIACCSNSSHFCMTGLFSDREDLIIFCKFCSTSITSITSNRRHIFCIFYCLCRRIRRSPCGESTNCFINNEICCYSHGLRIQNIRHKAHSSTNTGKRKGRQVERRWQQCYSTSSIYKDLTTFIQHIGNNRSCDGNSLFKGICLFP